jgi:hypothetical protein
LDTNTLRIIALSKRAFALGNFLYQIREKLALVLNTSLLQQLREIRSTETGNGIPALSNRETLNVAAVAETLLHVVEALVALGVEPRVQEAERSLAAGDQGVVDEGEDTGGEGR